MRLEIDPKNPDQRSVDQAVAILQRGGIIVFPTDTGYAIGCDLFQKKAISRIFQIKNRNKKKPLTFICSNFGEFSQFAIVSNSVYRDMRRLLPGSYTFVLPSTKMVPKLLVSSRSSVGIRIPDHAVPIALASSLQHPIIGASCSIEEEDGMTDPKQIEKKMGKLVDLILDAGVISSEPSSVIDYSLPEPVIVREGKGDLSSFTQKKK